MSENNWTRKMPAGWIPGCCAICDIPCGQEQYKRTECPFTSATRVYETKRECDWSGDTCSCTGGDEVKKS